MKSVRTLALISLIAVNAPAHVGSPDVYLDGKAGPYQLFVTVRPPQVIPGVAQMEVRCESAGVTGIRAVPLPLTKNAVKYAPVPESLKRSDQDKQFFTGSLWLMVDGSSQIRLMVEGDQGAGVLSVPVPAIALTTRKMQWQLGAGLSVMGLLLIGGLVAIAGASVREARLPLGTTPGSANTRRGRIAMVIASVILVAVLWGGKSWWDSEAGNFRDRVYKPITMQAVLEGNDSATLSLDLSDPGWMKQNRQSIISQVRFVRKIDDLVEDHGHLMHLYVIRQPGLDVIYHLHPELVNPEKFRLKLPAMPAGDYKLYADVVHENGLPETLTAAIRLDKGIDALSARGLSGDDASAQTQPFQSAAPARMFILPDGYRMTFVQNNSDAGLHAQEGTAFHFRLETPDGKAPSDIAFYMGMLGHAAFVKTDGTVFAHIHPNGTVPMAAYKLAQPEAGMMTDMPGMDHSGMMDHTLPNDVSFPYGLPSPGRYRIFVQMKHGNTVETGVFDVVAQ